MLITICHTIRIWRYSHITQNNARESPCHKIKQQWFGLSHCLHLNFIGFELNNKIMNCATYRIRLSYSIESEIKVFFNHRNNDTQIKLLNDTPRHISKRISFQLKFLLYDIKCITLYLFTIPCQIYILLIHRIVCCFLLSLPCNKFNFKV